MEDVIQRSSKPIWEWDRSSLDHSRGIYIPLGIKLNFEATNNMAEYETCIFRMEALQELRVTEAEVFRDSTLVIAQA